MSKPTKDLPELIDAIRIKVKECYRIIQTQDGDGLSKVMSDLAMQNFSLSYYVAEYEFESRSLEAEYKRNLSVTFMQEREAGATEKNADSKAKIKWYDMLESQITSNKAYRLAKSTHADIENLIDIGRSRLAIIRKEREVK